MLPQTAHLVERLIILSGSWPKAESILFPPTAHYTNCLPDLFSMVSDYRYPTSNIFSLPLIGSLDIYPSVSIGVFSGIVWHTPEAKIGRAVMPKAPGTCDQSRDWLARGEHACTSWRNEVSADYILLKLPPRRPDVLLCGWLCVN